MPLIWESAEHDDEPGDQNATAFCVRHGYWSLGPEFDGRWSVTLVEQNASLDVLAETSIGQFADEQAAKDAAQAYEDERADKLVIVYFHTMGFDNDGVEWGNAITETHDPIEYDLTRQQFTDRYPDNVWDKTESRYHA